MIETTWSELYILQILVYTRQVCPSRPLIVAHASKYQSKFDDEKLTVSVLLGRWSVPAQYSLLARVMDHGPVMQATHLYKIIHPCNLMCSKR